MSETSKNIRVAVRVRPFNRTELEANQRNIIRALDDQNLIFDPEDDTEEFFFQGVKQTNRDITKRVRKKLAMEYDDVFDMERTNMDVYEACTKSLLDGLMEGYNCSVFVYGATGAGKTFTMLGSLECPGVTFLTMRGLFEKISEHEDDRKFDIGISYLEVYNEQVMNLLTKSGPMNLREDGNGVMVSGLQLHKIENAAELLELLAQGNRNRTQHPTDANAESSRSHAIFQVHIRMTDKKTNSKKLVKLSMIDLAGSERAASTQCKGLRFKEGANINKSLLALGNCISRLAEGSKYVPYRDSKLTRILKDSLGGNCRTVMIANISPSSLTYDDTYNTLKYASRAKKIKLSLRQNVIQSNVPKEYLIKKANEAADENVKLKAKIKQLEARIAEMSQHQQTPTTATSSSAQVPQTIDQTWYVKIDAVYEALRVSQEQFFAIQSREKMNLLKRKMKTYMETIRASMEVTLDEEYIRVEASVEKASKQSQKDREDLQKFNKIHRQAITGLDQLRGEISVAGLESSLKAYLNNKDTELSNHKLTTKMAHIQKVNSMYNSELSHWKEMLELGFQSLNQCYLLLRSFDRVDRNMEEAVKKLIKLCNGRQKVVKFIEENTAVADSLELSFDMADSTSAAVAAVTTTTKTICDEVPQSSGKKRAAPSDIQNGPAKHAKVAQTGSGTFVKPKAVKSINFNTATTVNATSAKPFKVPALLPPPPQPATKASHVPNLNETHTIESANTLNSTFDLGPPKHTSGNILGESGVLNVKESAVMNRLLKQSASTKAGILSKAATQLSKENKRSKTPKKFSPKKFTKGPILNGVAKARINLKQITPNSTSNKR